MEKKEKQEEKTEKCVNPQGKMRYFIWHSCLITMECVAVIVVIAIMLISTAVIILSSGPVNINFAKKYIEEALSYKEQGYNVSIGNAVLTLPSFESSLILNISDIVLSQDENPVIAINQVDMKLSRSSLFVGNIHPTEITIKEPELHLVRTGKGKISIDITNNVPSKEQDETKIIETIVKKLTEPAYFEESSPLKKLEIFEVKDAKAMVADMYLGVSWPLEKFNIKFSHINTGLLIKADLHLPSRQQAKEYSKASLNLEYNKISKDYSIAGELENVDVALLAGSLINLRDVRDYKFFVNGNFSTLIDSNYNVIEAVLDLNIPKGSIVNEKYYKEPLNYKNLKANISYKNIGNDGKNLNIENISASINDVEITTSANISERENGFSGNVNVKIPSLEIKEIASIMPKTLNGSPADIWLKQKISGNRLYDWDINFKLDADRKESENIEKPFSFDMYNLTMSNLTADFKYEGINVDYYPPLKAVKNASGTGNVKDAALTLHLDSAKVLDMAISKAHVKIDNMDKRGEGKTSVDIFMKGQIPSVLKYISDKPISIGDKLNFDLSNMEGVADMNIKIAFPNKRGLKAEEVKVTVDANLKDVKIDNIVRNMNMSDGDLKLKVEPDYFTITGSSKIDGKDSYIDWQRYLKKSEKDFISKIKVNIVADADIREKFGANISNISGDLPLEIEYTDFGENKSQAKIRADLYEARLDIKELGYSKRKNIKGSAEFTAYMKNGKITELKKLHVKSDRLEIKNANISFDRKTGKITSGTIDRSMIADNIFSAQFEIDKDNKIKIVADCDLFDLRPFFKNSNHDKNNFPMIISLKTPRMITSEKREVKDVQIYFDKSDDGTINQLEMDAMAGNGDIYLRYKPDEKGRLAFRLEADDAGATLAAFNIYDDIRGGRIVAYAIPEGGAYRGDLEGEAFLYDFKVVNAPVLAKLLSSMSLIGIGNLLGGEGLTFTKLETEFRWHFKEEGNILAFKEGRTSGNSLGLTFEGKYNQGSKEININGTIVPISMINGFISNIPLIGQILTGGSGGVFAATYKVEGKASNPKVVVNPLAVLAPGIIRKIIFED